MSGKREMPVSPGRPRLTKNTDIKEGFKRVSSEAINNVVDAMRHYKKEGDQILRHIVRTEMELERAIMDQDEKQVKHLEKRLEILNSRYLDRSETTVKHSLKILDYSYRIVVHEENLKVTRSRNNANKAKPRSESSDTDIPEEEDEIEYNMPVVSLKPVKNK